MGLPSNIIDIKDHRPVSPQKENGYMAIANEILDALCKTHIPARERQCLDLILRKTYGFNKKEDDISLSQFEIGTGIEKRSLRRSLESLMSKNIIGVRKNAHTYNEKKEYKSSTYWFNKKYDTWVLNSDNKRGVRKNAHRVCANKVQEVCAPVPPTKDNIQKTYTNKLKTFVGTYIDFISKKFPTKKPRGRNLEQKSLETIDKLVRLDGFTEDYIIEALRWAHNDNFWKHQVYSLAALREKSKNGLLKFQNLSNAFDTDQPEQAKPKILAFEVDPDDR